MKHERTLQMGKYYFIMNNIIFLVTQIAFGSLIHFIHFVLAVCYWKRGKRVPPIQNQLLLKSATKLANDIRHGKLKSKDLVQAYINRIQEVQPLVNAVVQDRYQDALEEANEIDKLVESKTFAPGQLEKEKPLLGVPFTVKMIFKVKGFPCNVGSKIYEDMVADEDAECVSLLKSAGGILLATTNIPEFSMSFETNNLIYGKTSNPYDTSRTPGGSSGGEGALIGAGASVIGIGNDCAGSVRIPAYFTGIFAHKPTNNLTSNLGIFQDMPPLDKYLATSPMCRYGEDLTLLMKVLAAKRRDILTFDRKVNYSKMKIFYSTKVSDPRACSLEKEIAEVIPKVASYFSEKYGATATEIKTHFVEEASETVGHMFHAPFKNITESFTMGKVKHINIFKELLKMLMGNSTFSFGGVTLLSVLQSPLYDENKIPYYTELLNKTTKKFEDLLDESSILLMPTFPVTAPYHYEMASLLLFSTCYTSIFNFTGHPVTAVPLGLNRNGLPYGIQIIGKKNNDSLLLACAMEIEKEFGGWKQPGCK